MTTLRGLIKQIANNYNDVLFSDGATDWDLWNFFEANDGWQEGDVEENTLELEVCKEYTLDGHLLIKSEANGRTILRQVV